MKSYLIIIFKQIYVIHNEPLKVTELEHKHKMQFSVLPSTQIFKAGLLTLCRGSSQCILSPFNWTLQDVSMLVVTMVSIETIHKRLRA